MACWTLCADSGARRCVILRRLAGVAKMCLIVHHARQARQADGVSPLWAGVGTPSSRVLLLMCMLNMRLTGDRQAWLARSMFLIGRSRNMSGISLAATTWKMEVIGYRVVTTGTQRLATQQSPRGQQAAAQRTKASDRDTCIIRAGWMEATLLSDQGTKPTLVQTQ